jgi:NAD-dependent deacetylase
MQTKEYPPALVEALRNASAVTVLTGAGVSAESGVPTFREAQSGLWAKYDPTQLATPQAFQRNPKLVWEWYTWRRQLVAAARPNQAHHTLVRLARFVPRLWLITQNVDGLHQTAGSTDVVELHGNIARTRCFAEGAVVSDWADTGDIPPRCPRCGDMLRPDVVWFGEALPAQALQTAIEAARNCAVFLSVGTSALVEPAASLPLAAKHSGAVLVEINPETTPLTPHVDHALRGSAGQVLPEIVAAAWP